MPLVGYHLIGFDSAPHSFDSRDFNLLMNPKNRERTERFFARTPHRFNLVFHNNHWDMPKHRFDEDHPENAWFMVGPRSSPRFHPHFKDEVWPEFFMPGVRLDPDAINIVYTGNATGEPKIPLTPHMMCHRLGHIHTLEKTRNGGGIHHHLTNWALSAISSAYGCTIPAHNHKDTNAFYSWGPEPSITGLQLNALLKAITTTRCGRDNRVNGWEYVPEWFAQYVNTGEIKFPEFAPEEIDLAKVYHADKALKVPPPTDLMIARQLYPLRDFRTSIEKKFKGVLTEYTGDIFVT